ncbi:putative transcriptional regulator [Dokdonella fugitiva]|uniref:Putative transcriptional regulator n=1 Tax=Dokdonella fugitiva TaxID=328517 RepID=A0A839F1J2_9GAMM|nr:ChrR family anti-sigma-E factor [Dokdonella fugitiva]MBA8886184.1 putative transcriptional regulator [Dokdonella fugitiva]
MSPRHHLDETTVLGWASGALSPEMAAVAATHLDVCRHCRSRLATAEGIGGTLLEQQQPSTDDAMRMPHLREHMLAALDAHPNRRVPPRREEATAGPDNLPRALHPYFGTSWRSLRWRWLAPGVRMIRALRTSGHALILLRIDPGMSMPLHSHGGIELTQVLAGSYDDELGHFGVGDAADLGPETLHRPVTSAGGPCVCVAALDAPLRFPGWFARMLQPLVGL